MKPVGTAGGNLRSMQHKDGRKADPNKEVLQTGGTRQRGIAITLNTKHQLQASERKIYAELYWTTAKKRIRLIAERSSDEVVFTAAWA